MKHTHDSEGAASDTPRPAVDVIEDAIAMVAKVGHLPARNAANVAIVMLREAGYRIVDAEVIEDAYTVADMLRSF